MVNLVNRFKVLKLKVWQGKLFVLMCVAARSAVFFYILGVLLGVREGLEEKDDSFYLSRWDPTLCHSFSIPLRG